MKKSELLELLKDIADDGDVLTTLKGIEGIKNNYTLEEFKEQLKTNAELKGYYQSQIDSGIGKGVASFKEKTLPSIIAEEVKKANNKTKTPEQIELEELKAKFEQLEKDKMKADLSNKLSKVLNEKGMNVDLLQFVISENEEDSMNNINSLEKIINSNVTNKVREKIVENPPIPSQSEGGKELTGVEKAFFERTGIKLD